MASVLTRRYGIGWDCRIGSLLDMAPRMHDKNERRPSSVRSPAMPTIEMHSPRPSRRSLMIGTAGLLGGGLALAAGAPGAERVVKNGRLKQSVCKWCYQMSVEELAAASKQMGLPGID